MNALRSIFRWWVTLLLIAAVVQVGFAGIGAFDALDKATAGNLGDDDAFYDSFTLHAALGSLMLLGSLLLLILALVARVGKQQVLYSLGIFVLMVAQLILGWSAQELPAVLGFLHPINALVIIAGLGIVAQREWMLARGGEPTGRAAMATPPPA
jgi:hypothetical protein